MLNLSVAVSAVDRHAGLIDGSVHAQGIAMTPLVMSVQEIFNRQLSTYEFDVSEMAIATLIRLKTRPDCRLVGIPIFPSRYFRQSCVFVNKAAGVNGPADLAGRRVGVPVFDMAAAVWLRGIFKDDYGLDPKAPIYVTGGLDVARAADAHPQIYPPGFKVERIGPTETLSDLLETGGIDALVTAGAPASYFRAPQKIGRLFEDFRAVEMDYFKRTGIFPMMHTVTIRRDVYEANRWIAVSLYKAFEEAHLKAMRALSDSASLTTALPWLVGEAEATMAAMGCDFWPQGLEKNRAALVKLMEYMVDDGYLDVAYDPATLFAPEALAYLKAR